ncbi:hypothetical protein [Paenibacillus wynnii]|uniref:Portal protein n=1 Tax=Paenibacillus wynnii TaxID=268407 RepID=A0A098MDC0_9BACL|nr:hypothetical protein [Paenibacillus wynnii]KGE20053.1 hypothetical protein PWYN_12425 [Paenibacillus wynnii]
MAEAQKQLGEETQIQKQYSECLNYMRRMGFLDAWPMYERFKAGDQWPPITERTKTLPRPVFNIIEYIQNHKVSSVMNENVKMLFSPQEFLADADMDQMDQQIVQQAQLAQEASEKFTRYSDTTWELIEQDEINEEVLESGSNSGTGIAHYYWDTGSNGGIVRPWIGDIAGEMLDPINVFFGNPQQRKVQRQPYIIISSREDLAEVKRMAKEAKLSQDKIELIKADSDVQVEGYDRAKVEVTGSEKVTVLTKYWRKDGKIWLCREASGQMIKPEVDTGFRKYPLAVMQWKRRKKSIHGGSDTEGIIPNQKAINNLMAMQLLSVQLTGWPKLVYNPNYIDAKALNNDPSQPIVDTSPPGQSTVRYLTPGAVSSLASGLVESFMDYTKQLSSAQDAATGDMQKGELNATAIMLLQKAAGVPIESIKKRFYRFIKDVGEIWEEFWKVKYNTSRQITLKDDDGQEYSEEFTGSKYAEISLNLKINVGPASTYSEELMMASLDKLFDKGDLDLEDYLEYAPQNVIPFKDRLLKKVRERKEMAAQQQAQQEAMMSQQPQVDPAAEQQAKLEQQLALKQADHQNKLEVEQIKSQTALQQAAMRQPAGRG